MNADSLKRAPRSVAFQAAGSRGFPAACLILSLALLLSLTVAAQTNVPPVDPARIQVSDFTDDELDLPYYLVNFHRVANSVPLEGALRGWITASVWRGDANQRTYNARVLESQLTLVYFYC